MNAANAVIFEGATADEYETTLTITDPTADRVITMQNATGTLAFTADITGTNSGTNTGDEVVASTTASGTVELATTAETNTGSDTGRAVTPDGLNDWTGGAAAITKLGTIATGVWQATDIGVAYGGTGVSTLTDGGVLLGSGTGAITAMAVLADGEMIVGDGTTDPVAESGATLRTSIGVGYASSAGMLAGTSTNTVVTPDKLSDKSVTSIILAASVDATELSARISHQLATTSLLVTAQMINEDGTTDYGNCIIDWECTTDGSTDSTNDIFVKFAAVPSSNVYVNITSIHGANAITPTYPS
jgi:hypothetical protein